MTNNRIYTYNTGSRSSTALKTAMGTRQLHTNRPLSNINYFINWGNGVVPEWDNPHLHWLNHPTKVGTHTNKHSFFTRIASQNRDAFLEYTTDVNIARQAINNGGVLYQRNELNGHGGSGIQILSRTNASELSSNARLWTLKENIQREFRVIASKIGDDMQIHNIQEKKKQDGWRENLNFSTEIRSEHTGWAFCEFVATQADFGTETAFNETEASLKDVVSQYFHLNNVLDFGGFDIALTDNGWKILEVNTAPGLGEVNAKILAGVFNTWSGATSEQQRQNTVNLLRGV